MIDLAKVGLKDFTRSAKILILTNTIYAFVLPVIDIFVASYIMRNSNDPYFFYKWLFIEQNQYQKIIFLGNDIKRCFHGVYDVFG